MTKQQKHRLLTLNGLFWFAAIALPPLMRLIPTSSGEPPKIIPLLSSLMLLILAGVSTAMWNTAIPETDSQ